MDTLDEQVIEPEHAAGCPHQSAPGWCAACVRSHVESERRERLHTLLKAAKSTVGEAFAVAGDRDQAARLHQMWLALAREVES